MNAATTWARAYRPLGSRTLLIQLAVLVPTEAALFASYRGHEADFHWATHFLVGLAVAALFQSAWLALKGSPGRGLLASILVAHLVAMAPDLLSSAGIPHAGWMNIFLGHIWVHYLPGGDSTWLIIALAASGAYAGLLSAWLAARGREVDCGLAPGIGLGGSALIRPQASPANGLSSVRYGPAVPAQVLLLHGLAASNEVWAPVARELVARNVSVLVPDLLGFGRSRTVGTSFALEDHANALCSALQQEGSGALTLVGHSFGCAVAVELARRAPHRVRRLVLIAPPVFRDAAGARKRLGAEGWLARQVVNGSPVASGLCGAMCLLRSPAARLLPLLARGAPPALAAQSVQHSWPAYRDAVRALLDHNPIPAWLDQPEQPTTIVLGDIDRRTPARDVLDHPHDAVEVLEVPGDHLLVYECPAEIGALIAARIPEASR